MKKNYIEPTSKCVEIEEEKLLQDSSIKIASFSLGDESGAAKQEYGNDSKSRSGYAHEDLGWDY